MSDPIDLLRERFQSSTRLRRVEISPLLDRLEADPGDVEAARGLMRHFHYFAGLGKTCGFPRVSAIGDEGEASALPFVRDGAGVPPETIRHWRELFDTIQDEVSR